MQKNKKTNFFTNVEGNTLVDHFKKSTKYAKYFDILVGYFRISGFHLLYKELENVDKIRILIGMGVDKEVYNINKNTTQQILDSSYTDVEAIEDSVKSLKSEIIEAPNSYDTELGVKKFIEFLKIEKLEIRVFPSRKLHAKLYINRFKNKDIELKEGSVITGSSNLSESGLEKNIEFNVELNEPHELNEALEFFEKQWKQGVDLKEEYINKIENETFLTNQITEEELYYKLLYEHFESEINLDKSVDFSNVPHDYMDLKYQKEAVTYAKHILGGFGDNEGYGGVVLSDVVGLGKTYVAALLALQYEKSRKLIFCPPVLKDYWEETFHKFHIPGYKVVSTGQLNQENFKLNFDDYDMIFIDESHKFRNQKTNMYEKLFNITYGDRKKIILISATPQNNSPMDLLSQISLFQSMNHSSIPGYPALKTYFTEKNGIIKNAKEDLKKNKIDNKKYKKITKKVSEDIRDDILEHIMIRRTRNDVERYHKEDMKKRDFFFPKINDPHKMVYELDKNLNSIFDDTLHLIKEIHYARYQPKLYVKENKKGQYSIDEYELQQNRNLGGFMKTTLLKRLESSFYAFKMTVDRFVANYEGFVKMYESGTVFISKKYPNLYDFIGEDNFEEIIDSLSQAGKLNTYKSNDFKTDFIKELKKDLSDLKKIKKMWQNVGTDPKLEKLINQLKNNKLLKDKKIIIFTEAADTAKYLYKELKNKYKTILFHGQLNNSNTTKKDVKDNFDPNSDNPLDELDLLITTDVLSEGMNLHRSNIVINYDLPWNPTKVLQRVGRINRIGTEHKELYIFNFFPAEESDRELKQTENIVSKLQLFHDTLGEDAKYLTDEEEISSKHLFGQNKFDEFTKLKTSEEGDNKNLRNYYLNEIRKIRGTPLWDRILNIPEKVRIGVNSKDSSKLITFFKVGGLTKFFISDTAKVVEPKPKEITFSEAIQYFKPQKNTAYKSIELDKEYYDLLNLNESGMLELSDKQKSELLTPVIRGNPLEVIKNLKIIKRANVLSKQERIVINLILKRYKSGDVPDNQTKKIKNFIESQGKDIKENCHKIYAFVTDPQRGGFAINQLKKSRAHTKISSLENSQIILSKYFIKK